MSAMFQMANDGKGIVWRSDDTGKTWARLDYLRFRDRFAEAMDARLYTLEYLDWLLTSGRGQFWSTDNAAIIAEIKTYPTGARAIHGLIAAGDLDEITSVLIPTAEEWARKQGCEFAMIESREGWGRQLKGSGYEPYQVCLRKVL